MKKGEKMSQEQKRKISQSEKGKILSKETRIKLSNALKGRTVWNTGTKGVMKPNQTSFKIGNMPAHMPIIMKGAAHPNWQGGKTSINAKIRNSVEIKIWREAVFKRDDYMCQECGVRSTVGKKVVLNADHIKQFAYHPELRFAVDNGRTLCVDCHRKTDTYAGRGRKKVVIPSLG